MKKIILSVGIIATLFGIFLLQKDVTRDEVATQKEQVLGRGTVLSLSNQNLTKVPIYIFSKIDIVELNLSHNNLEGSLPAEVRLLSHLKVLNLSNNKFTGLPAEVGQLSELEILDLSNNKLTGLPYELANLKKLKLLDISGNAYSEGDLAVIKKGLPSTTDVKVK